MGPVVRLARKASHVLSRNGLVRSTDRVQSALMWLVALVVMAAVPAAAAVGSVVFAASSAAAVTEQQTRHQVLATLRGDVPVVTDYAGNKVSGSTAPAYWQASTGAMRTGLVTVPSGLHAGDTTPIWIDREGNAVTTPRTTTMAAGDGVAAALGLLIAIGAALGALGSACTWLVRRQNRSAWDRGWRAVEPMWTGRLGRGQTQEGS